MPRGGPIEDIGDIVANVTFDDFIDQQTAPTDEPEVDWDQKRREWLQYLGQFYERVETFMCQYIDQGSVRVERDGTKELYEEFIGRYTAKTMALEIGRNRIEFDPVGTNLIGAKGRVDMRSAKGTVKFVLVPEDATEIGWRTRIILEGDEPESEPVEPVKNWVWKIATPPPRVECIELCKESFQDAIMEVVNG